MQRRKADIVPGTLEMLILTTLRQRGTLHGYGIVKHVQQVSDNVLNVGEGSLYPALQRLLKKGWVTAQWVERGQKRRARVYELTPEGRKQLASEVTEFDRMMQAIVRVIQPA
jgi:PadR family transcriptional regulator, regulatory protein PadR